MIPIPHRPISIVALAAVLCGPAAARASDDLYLFRDELGRAHVVDRRPLGPALRMPAHPDVGRRPARRAVAPTLPRAGATDVLRYRPGESSARTPAPRPPVARASRRTIVMPAAPAAGLRPVQDRDAAHPCGLDLARCTPAR